MEIREWCFCNSIISVLLVLLLIVEDFCNRFQFDVGFIFIFSYNFLGEAVKNSNDLLY